MNDILLGYILCFLCVFGIIGAVTLSHKLFKFSGEVSRKLIHALVGFTWFPMYFYLRETVHIIIVPIIFIVVNYLSARFSIFKSMERERDDNKRDYGTVYFAICMTVLSVFSYFFPKTLGCYGIAVFCLSFGDGAAAIAGTLIKKHNIAIVKGKTLAGSLACVLAAFAGIYFVCAVMAQPMTLWKAGALALLTAALEIAGGRLDNFAVSFGVMAAACLMV